MKRKLKFRTWFKKPHNCMDYDTGVFEGDAVVNDDSCAVNQHVVMQYIGIKDKNKEELYEDDIVILDNIGEGIPVKYIIEYSTKEIGFVLKCVMDDHRSPINIFDAKRLLKIGNIYENP